MREDQVLPHLPALLIRLRPQQAPRPALPHRARRAGRFRAGGIKLTYDPTAHTVTADTPEAEKIAIG
ncbi:hypothetical protein OG607_08265 [Streptomyces sp. NBC_01537]|uniref:hypothetical protein n=1 Tax=Streptomyces sp. NBC_01537 TaxID=2903896 RepID=UPI00386F758B